MKTRKYRFVSTAVVERVASEAWNQTNSIRDAKKNAQRKLHQIYGAFFDQLPWPKLESLLESPGLWPSTCGREAFSRRILAMHASTAERLPFIEDIYKSVFRQTGAPESILDLGCGLNPFAVPLMGLGSHFRYHAWDMDLRLASLLNAYFRGLGLPELAKAVDLAGEPTFPECELVLMLKLAPTLEQQSPGLTKGLLERLRSPWIVISFPRRTLGGRRVGMDKRYPELLEALLPPGLIVSEEWSFPSEIVFLLAPASGSLS